MTIFYEKMFLIIGPSSSVALTAAVRVHVGVLLSCVLHKPLTWRPNHNQYRRHVKQTVQRFQRLNFTSNHQKVRWFLPFGILSSSSSMCSMSKLTKLFCEGKKMVEKFMLKMGESLKKRTWVPCVWGVAPSIPAAVWSEWVRAGWTSFPSSSVPQRCWRGAPGLPCSSVRSPGHWTQPTERRSISVVAQERRHRHISANPQTTFSYDNYGSNNVLIHRGSVAHRKSEYKQ